MNPDAVPSRQATLLSRKLLLLSAGSILLAGCFLLLLLCFQVPSAFTAPAPSVTADLDRQARVFEQSFAAQLTRVRDNEDPWAIRVRETDLNAWIWTRLPHWVAHVHGSGAPGSTPSFQASLDPDRIRLMNDTFVLSFRPGVEDGWTRLRPGPGSYLGRLPVPGSLFELLAATLDLELLGQAVAGARAVEDFDEGAPSAPAPDGPCLQASFPLGDGRVVELLELQLDEGQMVMVFRTLS